MKITELKPGMVFHEPGSNATITITSNLNKEIRFEVTYLGNTKSIIEWEPQLLWAINEGTWQLQGDKPIVSVFRPNCKSLCRHPNVKKERFFSAKFYITCVDCGIALD